MATNRIAIRRDTAANWTSADPTLVAGEFGFETDTRVVKIGDGSTAYTALPSLGFIPAGAMMEYAGASAPSGWLLCDGSAVSRTTYAALFTAVGTTFGAGDTTTTFNLPDMREVAPVGVGTRGAGAAADVFTLGEFKDDQFQGHTVAVPTAKQLIEQTAGRNTGIGSATDARYSTPVLHDRTDTVGARATPYDDGTNGTPRTGTVTRGKRLGLNFIIKT